MAKKLFLLFILLSPLLVNAQYTTVINSNRPGVSESPYSVGSGIYQFETSLFFRKANSTPLFSNPKALGLNLLFRTSFLSERLEFNLNTTFEKDNIAFRNVVESFSFNKTGFSRFTLGAKYLIYTPTYTDKSKEIRSWKARHSFDWKRWIPHIGIYAGANFGSILTDYHNEGGITPKVGLLLQNEFSHKLYMITNVFYNNIGSDFTEFSYVLSGTYNYNDYWSAFAEIQQIFKKYEIHNRIGAGIAYLYNQNLQINTSVRGDYLKENIGYYASIGVSYRINKHVDKFIEIDKLGNKIEENKPTKYKENKNFFGRLLHKIGSIFKGKPKNKVPLDITPNEEGAEKAQGNIKRKRQKSLVDGIIKDDKKAKKKTIKENEKALRKAKKAKRKAEKKALKKAEKEKRRAEKELRKLEKKLKKEQEALEEEALEKKFNDEKKKKEEAEKLEKEIKELEEALKKEEELEKKEKEKEQENEKE
ncbi:transporter [Tenacibaculum maritimum]|uniref:transporter n=2 Tax=Tenacibaculum maritimum TaxID=107401 RepID=UPI0038775066